MNKKMYTIPLRDIPNDGLKLTVTEQSIWTNGITEFHIPCAIDQPLSANLTLLRTSGGCLIRGTLRGVVSLPCTKCLETVNIPLEDSFDEFEPLPHTAGKADDDENTGDESDIRFSEELPEETHILEEKGVLALDLSAFLWEEFLLALPSHPLCSPSCKGLCPQCGANLNEGPCGCDKKEGDPRLSVFRTLKISPKRPK